MADRTDEEIARAVQQGDPESFGALVERYEEKLRRYGRRFLEGEDIKDLVQDAFMKAYVNIRSFDPERSFSPWIYRIAHNEFLNHSRKRWREKIFPFDLDLLVPHPIAPQTADAGAEREETKRLLDNSLSGLPLKYREPLVLYYFEDMQYKEIADILQIPLSTVGVRINRAKTMLKKTAGDLNPRS